MWLLASQPALLQGGAAFVGTVTAAVLWRLFGIEAVHWAFRKANLSWANNDPSALATLTRSTRYYVTQIGVRLNDGRWLTCEDASKFQDAPFGPCTIGPSGDVGLYLTREEQPDGTCRDLNSVRDPSYGDRITYVPASQIQQITFRHKPRRPTGG